VSSTEVLPGTKQLGLKRGLGSSFALAVTVGGVIGLGILRTPGEIASVVPDPVLFLSLWLGGGLFVLLSTSVVVELVGMTPRSGGTYPLVRNAYGPYPGFVIGWTDWLSFAGDLALKAVVVMEFIAILIPGIESWHTPMAIAITTFFAALQVRGIALGAKIQQIAAASIAVIVLGFSIVLMLAEPVTASGTEATPAVRTGIGAWSLVLATIIFTYDGWMYAAYFSGEIKGGPGAVARACIKGIILVIALYLLLNASLALSLPLSSLAGHDLAIARALELAVSPAAASMVVLAAVLILLAHQNLGYMGSSRVLHALSVDGLASERTQAVSRGGNPLLAVLVTWAVTVGLILIGGFEFLLHLCVFFYVLIYVVLITGVLILRKRKPDSERPYRAWGHPYSTLFCLVGWIMVTVFQAVSAPDTALYALIMVAVSWPVYRYLIKQKQ
jgi:APA family basic amino acid/polyamine antiporter